MTVHAKAKPWRVVRQTSNAADVEVSAHRFEWLAELAAHRAARREQGTGVFYTARRVEKPGGQTGGAVQPCDFVDGALLDRHSKAGGQ